MESKIQRMSRSLYVMIGPEGATNFGIVKASDGAPFSSMPTFGGSTKSRKHLTSPAAPKSNIWSIPTSTLITRLPTFTLTGGGSRLSQAKAAWAR